MIRLTDYATAPPPETNKEEIQDIVRDNVERISDLLRLIVAGKKHSLLIVFQGMDASGKNGLTRRLFRRCSPEGLSVKSFKKPTDLEFAHDFLWRVHEACPSEGTIKIFNRSHYEDVLIQRVHKWISEEHAIKRIKWINAFEECLQDDNGTIILKFYLHISKAQQKLELEERIHEPDKHWKHNPADWNERNHWDEYMRCYEDAINRSEIPWHIIPMDKRWYADYVVSNIIIETLEKLDMKYPKLAEDE